MNEFPRIRCVGDTGILVEFGDRIAPEVNDRVVALDRDLQQVKPLGLISLTPAYASLLVSYNPLGTTPEPLYRRLMYDPKLSKHRSRTDRHLGRAREAASLLQHAMLPRTAYRSPAPSHGRKASS